MSCPCELGKEGIMMKERRYSVVYTEICGSAIVNGCELAAFDDLTAATVYFESSLTTKYTVADWIDYVEIILMDNFETNHRKVIRQSAV